MAGFPNAIKEDPAVLKYYRLNSERFRYFRWTPRTVGISLAYVVVFPSLIGYLAYKTDGKYDFRGKLRGDPVKEF